MKRMACECDIKGDDGSTTRATLLSSVQNSSATCRDEINAIIEGVYVIGIRVDVVSESIYDVGVPQ